MAKQKAEKLYDYYLNEIEKKMGNKETETSELTKMGRQLFGKKYIGTFPSDAIPKLKQDQYVIINNDDSSQSGEHWLLAIKTRNNIRANGRVCPIRARVCESASTVNKKINTTTAHLRQSTLTPCAESFGPSGMKSNAEKHAVPA